MTMEVNVNVAPAAREWQAMADKFGAGLAKTLAGVGRASGAVASGVGEGAGTAKVGTQIEKLVRSFPGGGMMTDIGKAFKTGGPVVGMFAGLNTIIGFFKGALSQSKIFSAVSGTFFKIVGMMIDMMLMPLLPYFMRFLQWFMQNGTQFATNVGKHIAELIPKITKAVGFVDTIVQKIGGWGFWLKTIAVVWFGAWMIDKAMKMAKGLKKAAGGIRRGAKALKGLRGGGKAATRLNSAGKLIDTKTGRWVQQDPKRIAKLAGKAGKGGGLFGRMTGGLGRGIGGLGRGIGGIGRGVMGAGGAIGRGVMGAGGAIGRGVMGAGGAIGRGAMGAGRGALSLAGRAPGAIGRGTMAVGGKLATKTGLKAVARIGTGIIAKRGGAMLTGAAIGGGAGLAAFGVGAIPGALIGAVAGLVIGQATGVAIDAATGKGFDVKRAAIPGYSEYQDINEAFFTKTESSMSKNAKEVGAAADKIGQEIESKIGKNTNVMVKNSYIPDTIGSYMGIYDKMAQEAELAETEVEGEEQSLGDKIFGFFGVWGGKIKDVWNSAWGGVSNWWNKITGGAEDEGQPEKDAPAEEGGGISGFFTGWAGKIGGFFKSAWSTVGGWWNSIFGDSPGAGTSPGGQPADEPPDEENGGIGGFFGKWAGKIGGFFKSAWSTVGSWWNKITGGAEDEGQPVEETPNEGGGGGILGFFKGWAGRIGGFFKGAWGTVSGWWNKITGNAEDNSPEDDSPNSGGVGGILGFFVNFLGGAVSGVKNLFKGAWTTVSGWWGKITGSANDNQPEDDTPNEGGGGGILSFFTNFLGGALKGVTTLFKGAWGKVSGWWGKITGGANDNQPEEDEDTGEHGGITAFFTNFLSGALKGVTTLFKKGWGTVSGWWGKITKGADDNQPEATEPTPDEGDGPTTFFSKWKTGIGTKFSNTWNRAKGWWNKIFNQDEDDTTPDIELDAPGAAGEKISMTSKIGAKLIDGVNAIIGAWNNIITGISTWSIDIPEFSWTIMEQKTLPGWAGGGTIGPFEIGWDKKTLTPLSALGGFTMGKVAGGSSPQSGTSNTSSYMDASGDGEGIHDRMLAGLQNHYNNLKETHQANYDKWAGNKVIQDYVPTPLQPVVTNIIAGGNTAVDVAKGAWDKGGDVLSKLNPLSWGKKDEPPKPGEPGGPPKYVPWDTMGPLITGQIRMAKPRSKSYTADTLYGSSWMDADMVSGGWGGYQVGGKVPGPTGVPVPAMLHGGETILPTHLDKGWLTSTKGGQLLGGGAGGGAGTVNMMNKPTTINIYTTENAVQAIENVERMQMMDEASFFTAV